MLTGTSKIQVIRNTFLFSGDLGPKSRIFSLDNSQQERRSKKDMISHLEE